MRKTLYILVFLILSGFQYSNENIDLEKKIMSDIFFEILKQIIPPPPPPSPPNPGYFQRFKAKEGTYYYADVTDRPIPKKSDKRLILIVDSIQEISDNETQIIREKMNIKLNKYSEGDLIWKYEKEHKSEIKFYRNLENINLNYKIDLKNFNHSKLFKFDYRSKYPPENLIWEWKKENNSNLIACIKFSKIIFNKDKNYGFLITQINYGNEDDRKVFFIIKKDVDRWIIVDKSFQIS